MNPKNSTSFVVYVFGDLSVHLELVLCAKGVQRIIALIWRALVLVLLVLGVRQELLVKCLHPQRLLLCLPFGVAGSSTLSLLVSCVLVIVC